MATHPIVHVDFATPDPQATGKFYADLLGWQLHFEAQFDYLMFQGEPGPGGGFVKPDGAQYKPGDVLVYVGTDDIEATLRMLKNAGLRLIDETPRTGIRQSRVAFLHPSASGGVLTEIVQPAEVH